MTKTSSLSRLEPALSRCGLITVADIGLLTVAGIGPDLIGMDTDQLSRDWPYPDEGVGDHRVIVDGDPALTITTRADVPGGARADGGNTTAANRLLGALNWLAEQKPGVYDGLQVPLRSALPLIRPAAKDAHP